MTQPIEKGLKSVFAGLPWPALALAALIWLMSVAYGFQYLVMRDTAAHLIYFRIATVPFAALAIWLTWFALRGPAPRLRVGAEMRWLGWWMMSVSWVLTCYFNSAEIAPLPWPILAVGVPAIAAASLRYLGVRAGNAAFLAGAVGVSVSLIFRISHDSGAGDMLQIIGFAASDLLRGVNPFQPYLTTSGKEVPFGYWPGIWLPYVPFVALGIDMRVLNLTMFALIIFVFKRAAGGGDRAALILALLLYPFLLSSQVLQMVLFGHLWLYWLLLCGSFFLVAQRRYPAAAVLLGICLASRPTVLFVVAPLAAYVWSREGFPMLLRCGLISLAIAVGLNAPFLLLYGHDFLASSYARLVGFSQVLTHFSLAGILRGVELEVLNRLIQVLIAVLAVIIVVRRKDLGAAQFVMLCGLSYVWEVLFASYATRYTYFPGFLLIALGLSLSYADRGRDKPSTSSARAMSNA